MWRVPNLIWSKESDLDLWTVVSLCVVCECVCVVCVCVCVVRVCVWCVCVSVSVSVCGYECVCLLSVCFHMIKQDYIQSTSDLPSDSLHKTNKMYVHVSIDVASQYKLLHTVCLCHSCVK